MSSYKIAVIGGGPAGCTLGRLLSRINCKVTIFEAEESLEERFQGGSLDLRDTGGILALTEAGLHDEFLKKARYEGEYMVVADKHGRPWFKIISRWAVGFSRPEIDRRVLRQMLYDSLPEGMVRWSHKLQSLRQASEGDWELQFTDGSKESGFDLVIGADGCWSHARKALTDVRPEYSGIHGVWMRVWDLEEKHPDLYKLANRGSIFTYSDGMSLSLQYIGDGSLQVGLSCTLAEDWMERRGLTTDDPEPLRAALLEQRADWNPLWRKAVEMADGKSMAARALYMLPVGATWEHRRGLTLVGDAAHVMTPFSGIGVNMAMQDAVMLYRAVKEAQEEGGDADALDKAMKDFETAMFENMLQAQQVSWGNAKDMLFAPGAPRTTIESYVSRTALREVPPLYKPFMRLTIWLVYFFLRIYRWRR